MSDISLRAYQRKIESWIEENNIDKAISQSAAILEQFPKDLQTWRCLSKALLQKQDFEHADQVFDIILDIDPDDFVSHIGKSTSSENRSDLDMAIEHMRRAFELQPANEGLQNELKRLILKKDGTQPDKIRLTRGALIKMYITGGLFDQAVSEALIGIRESPRRIDYKLALAEGYKKTGEPTKAVETCVSILKGLPYCLKANQIVHDILSKSSTDAVARVYQQHLSELDPYNAYVSETTSSVLDVPDIAVMLADRSAEPAEYVDIAGLIQKSWKMDDMGAVDYTPSDWDEIIKKALDASEMEMNLEPEDYEEVSQTEMGKKPEPENLQPGSKREAFLEKLRPSSHKDESQTSIPEWIFDQDGDLVQNEPVMDGDAAETYHEEAISEGTEEDFEILAHEPLFFESQQPEEAESVWVSELTHQEPEAADENPISLQDTQQIRVKDYHPAYMLDIAEKAVIGENYQYALSTLRKMINQGDHLDDVVRRLEIIVRDHPHNSDLLLFLGELYTRQGKRAEALEIYKRAQKNISL